MRILVASSSYKESLSSIQATNIISDSILQINPEYEVIKKPLSDGGTNFEDIIISNINGRHVFCEAHNAIGKKIKTQYGVSSDNNTAIIEMAKTCALANIPISLRNPLNTSSFGVGEQINHAIQYGCNNIILGLGDTGTHDMGLGLLQALQFEFYDHNHNLLLPAQGAQQLTKISEISDQNVDSKIKSCHFTIACDVNNPLLGENGSAHTFARQKGASPDMINILEKGATKFANILKKHTGKSVANIHGTGAAGGVAASMLALLNSQIVSGIGLVIKYSDIEKTLKNGIDLVITGEGKIDHQSLKGKASLEVSKLCQQYNIPVIAFCGILDDKSGEFANHFTSIKEISPKNTPLSEALKFAPQNLAKTTKETIKSYLNIL